VEKLKDEKERRKREKEREIAEKEQQARRLRDMELSK